MSLGNFSSLALDVGGVLLFYSASNIKTLTPRQLSNALDSPIWHDYERGKVSKKICYDRICRQFGFDPNTWIEALDTMRESLRPNVELIDEIKRLKLANPQLKVFGLSNISAEDFQQLKPLVDTCGIFDEFYASCLTSQRKPDVACYERFLEDGKISPETCVFVDGRIENVVVAQSLGFRSLHFNDTPSAVTTLRNLFGDPVSRGLDFLSRNAKKLFLYPDDSDTTSLAMLVLDDITPEEEAFAVEQILSHLSPDGLPYIDKLPKVYQYLCRLLQTEAYLLGTRYYDNPGWFLFLLSDVCGKRSSDKVLSEMRSLLTSQIQDRMGCDRNIFGAALRSLAAQALGIENKRDVKTLLETQQIDGGWERQWLWKYGKEAVKIGSRGVVTAMAVRAIKQAREDG
ncbi:hypothetical protein BHE90_003064 [Fusarium euwallaceae]|uniref:Uncharacterized protein n=1 Tax=Fusarium euwallaceae TaxID=1147111 RepID=A0A430M319_9HYPO|nr:hypothetical protein BHE90_003064 [Fusarium euwallaceae]